ncbi:MAG: restriction endonuclease [Bacteroidetes bacterium]|nr:restriction endonuclease [Bacteroidota bacterium]
MALPDFQAVMSPVLDQLSDGREYSFREIRDLVAAKLNISSDDRAILLPSGKQFVFDNRIGWAITFLKKAGLVNRPRRSVVVITPRGKNILETHKDQINVKFLRQFPEFVEFETAKKGEPNHAILSDETETLRTPVEQLESAYQAINDSLAQELLSRVLSITPEAFEHLVVELVVAMGYGGSIGDAGRAIGKTNDEGIDGIIKEDKLGLDAIYIQAKRWKPESTVGRPEIQRFVGALAGQGAKKGIFITTSRFADTAVEYAPRNDTKIVLIDGKQLAQLMIEYNVGVVPQQKYELKKIDGDYFGEE